MEHRDNTNNNNHQGGRKNKDQEGLKIVDKTNKKLDEMIRSNKGDMLSRDQAVQTMDTDIMDRTVVRYSEDNIVTITVLGHDEHSDDQEILDSLAIVAHNTLRLRIIPGKEYDYYQEIPEDGDSYDYCEEEQIPPPLPPRDTLLIKQPNRVSFSKNRQNSCEMFLETEKNQRKDLQKYLGMTNKDSLEMSALGNTFRKDLSKFLGVEQKFLRQELSRNNHNPCQQVRSQLKTPLSSSETALSGSEGYSSTYLSSSSSGSCTTSCEYYAASDRLS